MSNLHTVDAYLSGVDDNLIEVTGGLVDGVEDNDVVWVTTINAPSADNGINSLLCVVNSGAPWGQLDPARDVDPPWDFEQDLIYVKATNTVGSLRLYNDSEWRIVPTGSKP